MSVCRNKYPYNTRLVNLWELCVPEDVVSLFCRIFFQVDWSSLRHCPKKIQTNGITPMFL